MTLQESLAPAADSADPSRIADLEEALQKLETVDPRAARVVECRYFGGMEVEETAEALGVSAATVKRDWRVARAWLAGAVGRP